MKIAIIGSGIAGLTAAYRLHPRHDVTVFEADDRLGGHAHSIEIEAEGQPVTLDTGFMVFNDRNYPNFVRLLDELGVASRPTLMSFSVSDPSTGLEYNGHSLGTLFAQRHNLLSPRFYRMLSDIFRFNREARRLAVDTCGHTTVAEFVSRRRYSRVFTDCYLLPMGAAIWSCPTGTFSRFPLRFVAQFFNNHGLLDLVGRPTWRVIDGGSQIYVWAITRGFRDRIRLSAPVVSVGRDVDHVALRVRGRPIERFDHVIFACHSDQALQILGRNATATERDVLSALPYQRNTAVLHTDVSLLPRSRRAWASWNVRLTGDAKAPTVTTYNLNLLQGIRSNKTYCVTLNADAEIAPRHVLRTMQYDHPVFTTRRDAAQARHDELVNANRTSFCGAIGATASTRTAL